MRDQLADHDALDAYEFVFESPYVVGNDDVRDYALQSFTPGRPILAATMDLTGRIFREFQYRGGVSDVSTPVSEVFAMRQGRCRPRHNALSLHAGAADSRGDMDLTAAFRDSFAAASRTCRRPSATCSDAQGVCQDFAHLEIACLRSLGLAARYVSGYLLTRPPEGKEKLVGSDASHAWVSVFAGDLGWVDFDPTNNVIPGVEHITFAWGRDYGDVSPINGFIVGGGAHQVSVAVDVSPGPSP